MFKFSDFRNRGPDVLGQNEPRAGTRRIGFVEADIAALGGEKMKVSLFESLDDEDRGGVIIEICTERDGEGFQPVVRQAEGVVQIHMAGDGESKALLRALAYLLAMKRADRGVLGSVHVFEDHDEL